MGSQFDKALGSLAQLAVAYGVVLLVALALLGELLVFHVLLGYKGMSTYDYIVAERRRKEELLERKLDSQAAPAAAAAAGQARPPCQILPLPISHYRFTFQSNLVWDLIKPICNFALKLRSQ